MKRSKAVTKFVRIPPRKARLAANLIRGLSVEEADEQLMFCNLKSGRLLRKTLASAVANAETVHDARRDVLQVVEVRVDEGPHMKRAKSRSRGSRSPILKRTSHLTVVVGEKGEE
ncbi:MAG: 50S ribosomal protein L22 [Chlamydiales bacterium]|nr:50S ribosomal protein L22 [Chlamydiales bacterium]MCH9635773.1 50S ribosomal protein L22 [Chlamydiales bacterium]MCH9704315.1 50S ribosomal protein L22 [Chlamydiota bacterium]